MFKPHSPLLPKGKPPTTQPRLFSNLLSGRKHPLQAKWLNMAEFPWELILAIPAKLLAMLRNKRRTFQRKKKQKIAILRFNNGVAHGTEKRVKGQRGDTAFTPQKLHKFWHHVHSEDKRGASFGGKRALHILYCQGCVAPKSHSCGRSYDCLREHTHNIMHFHLSNLEFYFPPCNCSPRFY